MRIDGAAELRAIGEVERLRAELGGADMALQAAQSEVHRLRLTGALDRRASVGEANAAAARASVAHETSGRPVPGTMAPTTTAGGGTGSGDAGAPGESQPSRSAGAAPIIVRAGNLVDLFA